MKKVIILLSVAAAAFMAAACQQTPDIPPVDISIQLIVDGAEYEVSDIPVNLSNESHTFTLSQNTDEKGVAAFSVKPGVYVVEASHDITLGGNPASYAGSATILVSNEAEQEPFILELSLAVHQQIIIQELYSTGCPDNAGTGSTANDAYIVLYNNSAEEADATDVVFGFIAPYNGHGSNKYRGEDGELKFEHENWIPAYGAIWWFTANEVKIAPYSKLVVAIFGGIDHTQTYEKSVNLANANYYWMSNIGINPPYSNTKYVVNDVIPSSHYLTTYPFTQGNAWAISNSCPAAFIGKMPKADADALSKNESEYDTTMGTAASMKVVKFPKANVIGAVEVWSEANVQKSAVRFSADVNTGYVALTNKLGYTVYRNVDKAATEALPENAGKLVYNYQGALDDALNGEDVIDAEASMANGAHIIYKQTNDTGRDFHIRKVSALK